MIATVADIWPAVTAVSALGAIVWAAIRRPSDDASRLYDDAMHMLTEMREARQDDQQRIGALEKRVREAEAEAKREREARRELEREIGHLYREIEHLRTRLGQGPAQ